MEVIKGGRAGERSKKPIPMVPMVGDEIYVPSSIHAYHSMGF